MDPSSGCQVITCFRPPPPTQSCSQRLLGLHRAFMGDRESSLPIPSVTSLCEGLGHWGQKDRADGGGH